MKATAFPLLALGGICTSLSQAAPVDFVREVRPILEKHCYSCHGPEKQKGGLRLDIKEAAFKGGDDHAPNIRPGDPEKSPLLAFVSGKEKDLQMPPKGERLSSEHVGILARWIQEGATWPDGVDSAKLENKRDLWSLKPIASPTPPTPRNPLWARHPIDQFILARLEKEGLEPAPEVDRTRWLRRVTLDLTGLPPTPEQIAAFQADPSPNAYASAVDALLSSPRYGEHWAQHWLDVVRYADTHGFEVNTERPNAWPYRDYVIDAFNADLPYDQFIRDQIAGDAEKKDAATGFLVTASVLLPGQIGADDASKRLARQDALDEIVVNTSQTFLGLSVGCARCHDHKFDPISARDYYSMQSFFAGVEYGARFLYTPEAQSARKEGQRLSEEIAGIEKKLAQYVPIALSGNKRPALNARLNADRFAPTKAKRVRFTILSTNNAEPCLDEVEVFNTEGVNVALASCGTTASASGQLIVADQHDLRYLHDGKSGDRRSWKSNENGQGWVILEFPQEHRIDRVVWSRDRQGKLLDHTPSNYRIEIASESGEWQTVADASDRLPPDPKRKTKPGEFSTDGLVGEELQQARGLMQQKTKLTAQLNRALEDQRVFSGVFRAPDAIHLLYRGDPEQPKDPVVPAIPEVLGQVRLPGDAPEQDRRLALAQWLSSPQNPLTARVIVNRVWQWHFGTGLVETASDFGKMGLKPSHPELLDWLAGDFIQNGWSLKHLHKAIVLSATYRQSTQANPVAAAKDADARLLWRFPPRRLEAENIRDAMLAVAGNLNLKMYGRGFNLFHQRGGLSGFTPVEVLTPENSRRMVYAHKVRREPDAVFGAYDCPDAGQSTARRRESTTPIQALNLLNSRFTLQQAATFASRLAAECGPEPAAQVQRAYQLAFGRPPLPEELQDASAIVKTHGAAPLCRALFNSNEFLFIP